MGDLPGQIRSLTRRHAIALVLDIELGLCALQIPRVVNVVGARVIAYRLEFGQLPLQLVLGHFSGRPTT